MRLLVIPALVTAGLLLAPPGVSADKIKLLQDTTRYSSGQGGEFQAEFSGQGSTLALAPQGFAVQIAPGEFQTFCMEESEPFYPNYWYEAVPALAAIGGGISMNDRYAAADPTRQNRNASGTARELGDPICQETAYLYRQFWDGALADYNYTDLRATGRGASGRQLQSALWYLEGEVEFAALDAQARTWVAMAHQHVAALPSSLYNTALFGVRVLNIYSLGNGDGLGGEHRQSQLVVLQTGDYAFAAPVPVPASAWMISGTLGALALWRWRQRHRLLTT